MVDNCLSDHIYCFGMLAREVDGGLAATKRGGKPPLLCRNYLCNNKVLAVSESASRHKNSEWPRSLTTPATSSVQGVARCRSVRGYSKSKKPPSATATTQSRSATALRKNIAKPPNRPPQGRRRRIQNLKAKAGVSADGAEAPKVGDQLTGAENVRSRSEAIQVTGTSKGKGWSAGTIKRHNFTRGPKTHGSHNYRAPGSIEFRLPGARI